MVIPVELPALTYMQDASFDIARFQFGDENAGGAGQVTEWTDPHWRAAWSFAGFPTRQTRDVWLNFLRTLRGRMVPVLAFDPARRVPLAFYDDSGKPLASGSPWGSPVVADYDRSASTFDLTGFTANQQLYAGDYISFQDTSDRWHLHALTEDAQADGSGDVTVTVEFRPARGLTHGGAAVRMRDACCTMVLQWPLDAFRFGADSGAPFTVTGHQVFKAFL